MLVIEGAATARNASVDFQCRGLERLTCDVHVQLDLEAGARGARVLIPELLPPQAAGERTHRVACAGPAQITIDAREVAGQAVIAAHQRATLEVRYSTAPALIHWDRPLARIFYSGDLPVDARHPLLGEGWRFHSGRQEVDVLDIVPGVTVEGTVRLDASMPPGVEMIVNGERMPSGHHEVARLPARVTIRELKEPPLFVNGGPVVTLGGLIRTDNAPTRFILGVGYELGFADYFLLSAWIETDFESIQEAVLVEVASPAYIIVPTVAAGVGVVSTQLGDRGVDVGLRMRGTIDFYVVGFVADFDYFVLSGGWNIALAARLSL